MKEIEENEAEVNQLISLSCSYIVSYFGVVFLYIIIRSSSKQAVKLADVMLSFF